MRIDFTKMHGVGQRLHRLRAPADRSPAARAAARAGRPAQRHRLRPGAGAATVRGAPTARSSTGSSMPTVTRSSSAATARAASQPCCTTVGHPRDGAVTLDSPAGLIHARIGARGAGVGGHGRARTSSRARCPSRPTARRQLSRLRPVAGRRDRRGLHRQSARRAGRRLGRAAPVATLGPLIESHPRFPKRVNVGFLEIGIARRGAPAGLRARRRGNAQLRHRRVRGGGGGRAAVCSRQGARKRARRRVAGKLGGTGEPIWLSGPTEISFEGHVEV